MPNGLHDSGRHSYSPREMAVDVQFDKHESERWKRHSIAHAFEPNETSDPDNDTSS